MMDASSKTTDMRTADQAVPPLDDDTEGQMDDLSGFDLGIDLIVAGFRRVLTGPPPDRDRTQTILAMLCGSADGTDLTGLIAMSIRRLTDYDTNPCLRDLDPATAHDVRSLGEAAAIGLDTTEARDLSAAAIARIDPYANPGGGER